MYLQEREYPRKLWLAIEVAGGAVDGLVIIPRYIVICHRDFCLSKWFTILGFYSD